MIQVPSSENLAEILRSGEGKRVEFQARLPPDDVIAMNVVAFANSDGGVLLVGVSDKGAVLGLTDEQQQESVRRLTRVCDAILPGPVRVGTLELENARLAFAVIPPAPEEYRPITTARGEIYHRVGTATVKNQLAEDLLQRAAALTGVDASKQVLVFVAMSFRTEEEPALVDYFRAMERAAVTTGLPLKLDRIDLVEGDYEATRLESR